MSVTRCKSFVNAESARTEHGGRRYGTRPAEAQLVRVGGRIVRLDTAHAIDAVGRGARRVGERAVEIKLDVPAGERLLVRIEHVVEVRVVPHAAVDEARRPGCRRRRLRSLALACCTGLFQ
jgi:hypothetical protein